MRLSIFLFSILLIFSCGDQNQVRTFTNNIIFAPDPITKTTVDSSTVSCTYTISFQEIRGKSLEIVYARESVGTETTLINDAVFQEDTLSDIFPDRMVLPGQIITLNRTTTFPNPSAEPDTITWLITGVDNYGNFENFVGETQCE